MCGHGAHTFWLPRCRSWPAGNLQKWDISGKMRDAKSCLACLRPSAAEPNSLKTPKTNARNHRYSVIHYWSTCVGKFDLFFRKFQSNTFSLEKVTVIKHRDEYESVHKFRHGPLAELFHFVLPAGTVHLHRTSGKDTPYFRYFSSPQASTSVTVLQIISKLSDATWLKECRFIRIMDWLRLLIDVLRWDLSMKPEKSNLLHRWLKKCKIIVNISEHCGIVHSFGLSSI